VLTIRPALTVVEIPRMTVKERGIGTLLAEGDETFHLRTWAMVGVVATI
jgi:hypothetical protein